MPYIPKHHEKYNLLPMCRANGGEVFEYPSELLRQLEELGFDHLVPYGVESYETYYSDLDEIQAEINDKSVLELFKKYKIRMLELNQKENWSVLRYIGENTEAIFGLTKHRYYYWPCPKENAAFRGVIDDEEFTAYQYPTEAALWEIAEDPTGMAYRTIFEGKDAVLQENYDRMMRQAEAMINSEK